MQVKAFGRLKRSMKCAYRMVELELPTAGFNGDANWLMCNGLLQSFLVIYWNILVPINCHHPCILLQKYDQHNML